jgi:hypothetical protein
MPGWDRYRTLANRLIMGITRRSGLASGPRPMTVAWRWCQREVTRTKTFKVAAMRTPPSPSAAHFVLPCRSLNMRLASCERAWISEAARAGRTVCWAVDQLH